MATKHYLVEGSDVRETALRLSAETKAARLSFTRSWAWNAQRRNTPDSELIRRATRAGSAVLEGHTRWYAEVVREDSGHIVLVYVTVWES